MEIDIYPQGVYNAMMRFIILKILVFSLSFQLKAHPVIYKGGWIFQGSFMPKMNELRLGYTASPRYAYVFNAHHFKNINNYQDYTVGMNFLIKRWLQRNSQGNLYTGLHGGYFQDDVNEGKAGHFFLMGDWETREHYVMARAKKFIYDNSDRYSFMARYGFAPFIAGMDQLQTWMILQTMYVEDQSKKVIITPMIRFFYKNVLWEIGHSTRGQSYLTLMIHY